MKNITCCLSILSGLLLQSCDITRMEPPAYKIDRASTRTYENLIFYEVLTDGQQYDAARLSLIASNIRKNTDVKYTALFIEYKEYGSAPSYAATSMNGDSVVTRLKSGEETRNGQETDAPPADSSVDSLNEPEQKTETADRRKQPSDSDDKTVLGRFRDQFSNKAADIISTMLSRTVPTACRSWKFGRGTAPKHIMRRIPRMNST